MGRGNVEIVERAVAAINDRDVDAHLACCTDDVQLSTPASEISGVYEGHDGIRRFLADMADTTQDFHLAIEQAQALSDERVLVLIRLGGTARLSGLGPADILQRAASGLGSAEGMPIANVYDLVDGKISRIRVFFDREQAVEAARLRS